MRYVTLCAVAAAFTVASSDLTADELRAEWKAALEPLARLEGTWEKTWTIHKSEWTPEELKSRGNQTCRWILDKVHLQEEGKDADGSAYMNIYSYDPGAKGLRATTFRSKGEVWQMVGKWDEKAQTFTWTVPGTEEFTPVVTIKFTDRDSYRFDIRIRNRAGKEVYHLEGMAKRVNQVKE